MIYKVATTRMNSVFPELAKLRGKEEPSGASGASGASGSSGSLVAPTSDSPTAPE